MDNVAHLVDSIDDILDAAKKVKSAKTRYETTMKRERDARDSVKKLQREAHSITTAMVNSADMSQHRDLQVVQRELLRAHNKVDSAIDKSNDEAEVMEEACKAMEALIEGRKPEPQAVDENIGPAEAMGNGIFLQHDEGDEENKPQQVANA